VLGEVAKLKLPIKNPLRFKSWIESAISGCTVPPHPFVRSHVIALPSEEGFVATLIAKSYYAPHQSLKPNLQYYIRAGSEFLPTPHAVLMGLFGRRPQPFVFHMWVSSPPKLAHISSHRHGIEFNFGIQLGSHGPGLARGLYLNADFGIPAGGTKMWFEPDRTNWTGNFAFARMIQLVSHDSYKLAPEAFATPLTIKVVFAEPFESDLYYKIVFGHDDAPTRKIEQAVQVFQIREAFLEMLSLLLERKEVSSGVFMERFLGITPETEDQGHEYYGSQE
jgi:hypothetical protein